MEIYTSSEPVNCCCIVLHGLGASGLDLRPLAPALYPANGVRWVFPDAPVIPISINGGMPMRAWYDVRSERLLDDQDAEGIIASAELISDLINNECSQGLTPEQIVLIGFSQGGAMALHVGLRANPALGAIVALSTYLPLAKSFTNECSAAAKQTSVFLGAGQYDPVIAEQDTVASGEQLTKLGYKVQAKSYPIEHAICNEEIADVAVFLQRALG